MFLPQIGLTVLTALLSVAVMFLLTKLMGTKQVSQMTMFDYITGITVDPLRRSWPQNWRSR